MIHKVSHFFLPKYRSKNNTKEDNLGLGLENKYVHYNKNYELFLLKFF